MKVHLITGLLEGGAANGAKQLARSLRDGGTDATLYYPSRLTPQEDASCDLPKTPIAWQSESLLRRLSSRVFFRASRQRFKRMMKQRPDGFEIFSSPFGSPYTPWPPTNMPLSGQDILHLHWIAKLIDYESFFNSVPRSLPIVWTLHDMNPLTGGCHFSGGCDRFRIGCGDCPQLSTVEERHQRDFSAVAFQIKAGAMQGLNLHLVAPSRWLISQAMQSPILADAKSFHHIPYGLSDETIAGAVDQAVARQTLDIAPDTFVFCFGAADIENERKGARYLLEALDQFAAQVDRPILGLVFGGGEFPETNVPIRSLGFLKTSQQRMEVFGASDVFVVPSTEDNLPITAMEAMAGGSAMLGFDVSGIPDLVIDGKTGRLAKPFEAADLAAKLLELANDPETTRQFGENARTHACKTFPASKESQSYHQLYETLLRSPEDAANLPTSMNAPSPVVLKFASPE